MAHRKRNHADTGGRDIPSAVRDLCLAFPEAWETLSHGAPEYRIGKRTFATLASNHHGDGRLAPWLPAQEGAQEQLTLVEPEHFFVPPYVGPKGWLGVHLDRGLSWPGIAELVRQAYVLQAPAEFGACAVPEVEPPTSRIDPEDFDPQSTAAAQALLDRLHQRCLALPEVTRAAQFGDPCWKAGKKTFVSAHRRGRRLRLAFWVGADRQTALSEDPRYRIPAYSGHNGWIEVEVEDRIDWDEVDNLLEDSYRHFALKRMLEALAP